MGYESVEKKSLETLEKALSVFCVQNTDHDSMQLRDEVDYELQRIRAALAMFH